MIEHHVQDYFNSVVVKGFDQSFQFRSFPVVFIDRGKTCIGGKKADSIIPPVFQKTLPVDFSGIHGFVKLKNRHQLYGIDSQLSEIGDLFHQPCKGASVLDSGGLMYGKTSYMKLVNNKVTEFFFGLRHIAPVKGIFYNTGVVGWIPVSTPGPLAGNCLCIWIQKNIFFVKKQSLFRIPGAVYAVGVFKVPDIQTVDDHGIYVADFISLRKGKNSKRFFLFTVEKKKLTGCSATGVYGKVHAVLKRSSSVQIKHSRTDRKSGDFSGWINLQRRFGYKFLMIGFHNRNSLLFLLFHKKFFTF